MKIIPKEFEIPFYKYTINDWNAKKNVIKNIISDYSSTLTNYDDSCSNLTTFVYNADTSKLNHSFESILQPEFNKFYEDTGKKYFICNSWIQVYNYKDGHNVHSHGFGYSGILLVNFSSKLHPPPVFIAPFQSLTNPGQSLFFTPEIKEGEIIIFHSSILHYAPQNMTEQPRVIFAFNLHEQTT